VEQRDLADQEDLAWTGRGRDHLPPDPFPATQSEEGFQVTVFQPTSRLEVHGEIGPFTATIRYLLAPLGEGTHLVRCSNTLEPAA